MTASTIGRTFWVCELRPFALAITLVANGFRTPRVLGWSYDRDGMKSMTLIALAIITVPQALVLDLLFSHSPIVRIASALAHIYAITWSLALAYALRTEPHVIAGGQATFRFPLLQSVHVQLADIESVEFVKRCPDGVPRFGLGKSGIVVRLKAATRVDRPLLARFTSSIFVAADESESLRAALIERSSAAGSAGMYSA